MPPKAKVTKEQIIEHAFRILMSEGFEAITARRLATELDCSTQPVYYCFQNMEDLRKELYQKGRAYFTDYVKTLKQPVPPEQDFLEAGVAYIKGAKLEQKLFHFVCMEHNYALSGIMDLMKGTSLPPKESTLFLNIWLYAHGIACIVANNDVPVKDEEIRQLLTQAFLAFQTIE